MWWPQLVTLRTEIAPIRLPAAADYVRFPRGSTEELLGSTKRFSHQQESCLEFVGDNPEVLDDADQAFLMNHIRKGTRGIYGTGWCWFQRFCKGYRINPQLAPLPLIVKFVHHLYNSGVLCSVHYWKTQTQGIQ